MKYAILCKINIAYTFMKIEALLFQERGSGRENKRGFREVNMTKVNCRLVWT